MRRSVQSRVDDPGLDAAAHERAFVASRRALRASWGQIGRMLGLSEHDARVRFDPGYDASVMVPAPRLTVVADPPKAQAKAPRLRDACRVNPETVRAHGAAHRALAALDTGFKTPRQLAAALDCTRGQADFIAYDLKRKACAEAIHGAGERVTWRITPLGRETLKRLDAMPAKKSRRRKSL